MEELRYIILCQKPAKSTFIVTPYTVILIKICKSKMCFADNFISNFWYIKNGNTHIHKNSWTAVDIILSWHFRKIIRNGDVG